MDRLALDVPYRQHCTLPTTNCIRNKNQGAVSRFLHNGTMCRCNTQHLSDHGIECSSLSRSTMRFSLKEKAMAPATAHLSSHIHLLALLLLVSVRCCGMHFLRLCATLTARKSAPYAPMQHRLARTASRETRRSLFATIRTPGSFSTKSIFQQNSISFLGRPSGSARRTPLTLIALW